MLAEELCREVIAAGRRVIRVAVKVRNASFFTQTRGSTLRTPTTDPAEVRRGHGRPWRARAQARQPKAAVDVTVRTTFQ